MEPQATGVTGGRERGLLSPCVCSTLRMVSRAVTQLYDDILRPSGLRVTQFSILATIARSGRVPDEIPLFAEPRARIQVYTEAADAEVTARGAEVDVRRFRPGGATPVAALEHLATARGVRSVLCEGGPTLLRALVAASCIDHLLLTLAPLLAGGGAPNVLEGRPLDPPARLGLHAVHRAGDHLFMHYVPAS